MDAATIQLTDIQKRIINKLRLNPKEKLSSQIDGWYSYVEDFGLVNGADVKVLRNAGLIHVANGVWCVLTDTGKSVKLG